MLPHCVAGSVRPDSIKIENTNRCMAADRTEHTKKTTTETQIWGARKKHTVTADTERYNAPITATDQTSLARTTTTAAVNNMDGPFSMYDMMCGNGTS